MPNPSRTWTSAINQTFTSSVDQAVQFREAIYAVKVLMLAAGWSVSRSSDGTTAGAADNWASAAALEINTTGSGAWCVLTSPASWTNATTSVLLYVNNASADTTPQGFVVRATTGTYSGGSDTALPTASATETAIHTTTNILGHTSAVAARYATWRSSRGDVMFGVKTEGVNSFGSFLAILSNSDASGAGRGSNRFWVTYTSSATDCLVASSLLTNSGYTTSLQSGGGAAIGVELSAGAWNIGSWTSGLDFAGETVLEPVTAYCDGASNGRYLGQWVDAYAVPTTLAFGTLDDSESAQTLRRVCVGDIALYAPTASLPFV